MKHYRKDGIDPVARSRARRRALQAVYAWQLAGGNGFRVLAATGVESEANLSYAGLHQLLRPLLDGVHQLPVQLREALLGAFGMLGSGVADRFLTALAALELLADAAHVRPQLVVIDDAQWLDTPTVDALGFIARRIDAEPIDAGAEDGVLLYVKPAIYGDEPQDVLHYKRSHDTFPHETTADQFFDEAQFESYRALGSFVMNRVLDARKDTTDLKTIVRALYAEGRQDRHEMWPTIQAAWLTTDQQPLHASCTE